MRSMPKGEDHPMRALAVALREVEYPPPRSDARVRIGLMIAPCAALVAVSVVWPASATLLLTFAGAFASIQLARPYERWIKALDDHLAEAREERLSAWEWARVRRREQTRSVWSQGFRPVGYSPAGLARARRRFVRVANRWRRHFVDISGRLIGPEHSVMGPAAMLADDFRRGTDFSWMTFIRRGKNMRTRIARSIVGGMWAAALSLREKVQSSRHVRRWRRKRAERLLAVVGRELIRATQDRAGDAPVIGLAKALGLDYATPAVPDAWVWREPVVPRADSVQPAATRSSE